MAVEASSPTRAILQALALAPAAHLTAGHAFLASPPSRNLIAWQNQKEYCPHCLHAGGPGTVSSRGDGAWPTIDAPQSHGLCGDPVQGEDPPVSWTDETYMNADPVGQTYTAGDIVEFQIGITAHHKGHYEFRICNRSIAHDTISSPAEGQACLNQWVLERAPPRADCQPNDPDADCQPLDPDQPHRWFLPPPNSNTQSAGSNWDDSMAPARPSTTEVHRMRYKIPAGLSCPHCTLQWYWSTGNTCVYDGLYFSYFKKMAAAGWQASAWCDTCMSGSDNCAGKCCGDASGIGMFGEEFWNCADIRVLATGEQPPIEPPTPAPQPTPPAADCLAAWQQCGGVSHTGPTCCQSGHYCKEVNQWYHQCVPGVDPNPTSPPSSLPTSPPTSLPSAPPTSPPPSPPAPTPMPPAPLSCADLCARNEVASCSAASSDESTCQHNFVKKLGFVMPCTWTPCGCWADGEKMLGGCACGSMPEPESEEEEEEQEEEEEGEEDEVDAFLQVQEEASPRKINKHSFLSSAFLQVEQCIQAVAFAEDEDVAP